MRSNLGLFTIREFPVRETYTTFERHEVGVSPMQCRPINRMYALYAHIQFSYKAYC